MWPVHTLQKGNYTVSRGSSSCSGSTLRACLHGGGGPPVAEVNGLGGVTRLYIQ